MASERTPGTTAAESKTAQEALAAEKAAAVPPAAVAKKTVAAVPVEGEKKDRKPRVVKEYAPLDFTQIEIHALDTPQQMGEHRRTRGDRGDEQKYVDKIVKQAYERWVSAGKPDAWVDSRGLRLRVPDGQVETLQFRIRKAGTFYAMRIRFGDLVSTNGKTTVPFIATDPKSESDGDEDGDEDGEAGDADTAEDNAAGGKEGVAEAKG